MRTRELFQQAAEQLAALPLTFDDAPAFTYRPTPTAPRPLAVAPPERPLPRAASGGATIAEARLRMARGEWSARGLVRAAYEAIAARDAALRGFTFVLPEAEAERAAAQLDDERQAGALRGPLHGIPVSVKDIIHVRGMPTTASSAVPDAEPQAVDAPAVARLRAAGAIVIGKTHTHEFALGVTAPQCRNPWDATRLAGGSSGGSAIAVATGMGLASLGTDTRASSRVPAALCGVVGCKATYAAVPSAGIVSLSWSMDHVAPLTKTVEDAAICLDVLLGPGPRRDERMQPLAAIGAPVAGLHVGVPGHGLAGANDAVAGAFAGALARLRELGLAVLDVEEPDGRDFALANAAGLIVSRVEAAAYHRPWRERAGRYTPDVGAQLEEAAAVPAVSYIQAQRYRAALQRRMLALFERVDLLAMPTTKMAAPTPEESEGLLLALSENCIPWSFLGFPALSVPCGAAPGNLPIGLELVAAPYHDELLLATGSAFEAAAGVSYV